MFPIGDDNSDRSRTPVVNYLLIGINIFVFIFLQQMGNDIDFTYSYSTVPAEIVTGADVITPAETERNPYTGERFYRPGLGETGVHVWLTLIISMFMHGGWAHLGGNMMYLWVFGDNLENRLGHLRYLMFYLVTGIIASLVHVFTTQFMGHDMYIPSLGASGAISGVLGGYMLLYPTRAVHLFVVFTIITVPSIVALGLWIVFQIINGMGALGGSEAGGVAYSAHIGGFIAGLILIKFFAAGTQAAETRRSRGLRRGF
ncbi:MAG TPA: rhomboid family intramembrane serine protease [Chitinophagaceae bacterium]|nr:rhomboid family intramembrane serine protease [Chitinophagaceae bacterium]